MSSVFGSFEGSGRTGCQERMVRTMNPEVLETSEIRNESKSTKKKKRKKGTSSSEQSDDEESILVGMVAVGRADGIFSKPHEVGKFVGEMVGEVRSVSVTRSGLVIIDCKSRAQCRIALDICGFQIDSRFVNVRCFELDGPARKTKGVISGVPIYFDENLFLDVDGVLDVRRLMRTDDGVKKLSTSVCVTFDTELPERIYLDYICYRVRPFERGPLRCFVCQEYGHVGSVCRGVKRCALCGRCDCADEACKRPEEDPKCLHCQGNHRVGATICPRRINEEKINNIRKSKKVSYAEAVQQSKVNMGSLEAKRNENLVTINLKNFLAFLAIVLNGATGVKSKMECINKILEAAKMFMKVDGVSEEDLAKAMEEGCIEGAG